MVKMRQRHLCVFEFEKGSFDEICAYIQYNADFMRDRLLAFHDDITPELKDFLCGLGAVPFKVENKKILQQGKAKHFLTEQPTIESHDATTQSATTEKIKITIDSNDSTCIVVDTVENKTQSRESIHRTNDIKPRDLNKPLETMQIKSRTSVDSILHTESMPMVTFKRTIRSGEEIILESHATFIKDIHVGSFIKSRGNLHIYGRCNGILECLGDYIIIGEFAMGRITLQHVNLEGRVLEEVQNSTKLKMLTVEDGKISLCELT